MRRAVFMIALASVCLVACRQDMHDAPRYEAYESAALWNDGMASRDPVPGTIARGHLDEDTHLHTGKVDGQFVDSFPFEMKLADLERGQERYNIYCSPCHDQNGSGKGMIVERGFQPPPSLFGVKVRSQPAGYYFDVITNGFGAMYSYRHALEPEDRWRVAAYLRVLQFARNARFTKLPEQDRRALMESLRR